MTGAPHGRRGEPLGAGRPDHRPRPARDGAPVRDGEPTSESEPAPEGELAPAGEAEGESAREVPEALAGAAAERGQRTRGPGRRPGPTATREAILAAARRLFAEKGYDAASIRAIARAAEVDPALIHHFFDNKAGLLVAALQLPIDPSAVITSVLAGPREQYGERLARAFVSIWSNPEARTPLLALMRSAITSEHAATMIRQFASSAVVTRAAEVGGIPSARFTGAIGQMLGVMYLRYVIKVEPLASASEEELVTLLAPVLQYYLGGGETVPVAPPAQG
jgi:AcrR family transcriptional regulator